MNSQSQDLSSHQWEDRLVLILAEDTSDEIYQNQIKELYSDKPGLKARKLVIYSALPKKYKRDDRLEEGWFESGELYTYYKKTDGPFEILLIGLDGGVKLRQSEFVSIKDLFGRIDQMPMRRREVGFNQKNSLRAI